MSAADGSQARPRILFLWANRSRFLRRLRNSLKEYEIVSESNLNKSAILLSRNDIRLLLLGHAGHSPCLESLDLLHSAHPSLPVIVLAGRGSERLAVTVFRHGARDYFRRPFNLREIRESIESALHKDEDRQFPRTSIFIGRALRYASENYTNSIRLPTVAREAGLSLSCFERAFKREMGITFSRYVNNLRITKAAEMLKAGSSSMSEIAFTCGFTNQYHFTRTFKKLMNLPPTAYRKS